MSYSTGRVALTTMSILALGGTAWAHAHLVSSSPVAGQTYKTSPTSISMTFTESLESSFTGISLSDDKGAAIPLGDETVTGTEATSLAAAVNKPLAAGRYHVNWHALSKDGHSTTGSFDFTVAP